MRKSKKVVFYSLMICFAFLMAVVIAVGNISVSSKVKAEDADVVYNFAVEGPDVIDFEYRPGISAKAEESKIYEYVFGNLMDETMRIMLGVDPTASVENVEITYKTSANRILDMNNVTFESSLSAIDIPSEEARYVYVKVSAASITDISKFKKTMTWAGGKPSDAYITVNGETTILPSIVNASNMGVDLDYSLTLPVPTLTGSQVFGGWYTDPIYSTPATEQNIKAGAELYAYVYTPWTGDPNYTNIPARVPDDYDSSVINESFVLNNDGASYTLKDYDLGGFWYSQSLGNYDDMGIDVYVPAYYNGLPVTTVDLDGASFYGTIYVPSTVTSLLLSGTVGMNSGVSIDPANPKYITLGGSTIERATKTLVYGSSAGYIPQGVEIIGENAFHYKYLNQDITIPEGVKRIERAAFQEAGLTGVSIPNSIEYIGYSAFSVVLFETGGNYYNGGRYLGNSSNPYVVLGSVENSDCSSFTIHSNTKIICDQAFQNCRSLSSITIPNGVVGIGDSAFYNCTSLNGITIPSTVTSIGDSAFYNCGSLNGITIPSSVTSIGDYAFDGCIGLSSITIPSSVTNIGGDAFRGCGGLSSIVVESGNTVYDSRDNCNAIIRTSTNSLIAGCKNTSIPNSVTSIGYSAFYNCSELTSVAIPSSVTIIGGYAFYGCSGLISIALPDSVTSIGYSAFSNCIGLTSITIPSSVTSIGSSAFYNCHALVEVYNLSSLTITLGSTNNGYLGYYAKVIYTSSSDSSRIQTKDNVKYYVYGSDFIALQPTSRDVTSITLDDRTTKINSYAFYKCSRLTSITIPSSVTSIGYYAFHACSKLTSISFEGSGTWYRTTNETNWKNKTNGTSTTLSNSSTAAKYFKSTYYNYYWYKK